MQEIFHCRSKKAEKTRFSNGLFLATTLLLCMCHQYPAFQLHRYSRRDMRKISLRQMKPDGSSGEIGAEDRRILNDKLNEWRVKLLEEEVSRPPNPDLSPMEFVVALLDGLWRNSEPLPDFGFRQLIRSSTPTWRASLYRSVGAPPSADIEIVASALGEAMGRPNNQYAILLGESDQNYVYDFPSDALDYADGTCWIECRFRDTVSNDLLCATGWELQQRDDGAWLVDGIDWQDFRDQFRPGVGREEWMRICG